jgi:transcriptional regulator with XRE-family HTH domain
MRKALRVAGIGVQEMATYLGVARNTVSTWINGKIAPSTQTIRLWAIRCDVPYDWLRWGDIPGPRSAHTPQYTDRSGPKKVTVRDEENTSSLSLGEAA